MRRNFENFWKLVIHGSQNAFKTLTVTTGLLVKYKAGEKESYTVCQTVCGKSVAELKVEARSLSSIPLLLLQMVRTALWSSLRNSQVLSSD